MNTPETLPPHSVEAERGALACVLLAPEQGPAMLAELHRSYFYDLRHAELLTALVRLMDNGKSPDTVNLCQHLADRGELERSGGMAAISTLADAAPSAAQFPSYLATLRDKAQRRQVLQLAHRAVALATDEALDPGIIRRDFAELFDTIAAKGGGREWFRFYTPGECRAYVPPAGHLLVGDCHLVRGSVTVIAGAPGVGKSRAGNTLALSGATGKEWFGLPVHARFKTAILQAENGRFRLAKEFAELDVELLNNFVRISDRPPYGMAFDSPDYRRALGRFLSEWKPDVLVLDPWASITRDDKQREYREAFDAVFESLPKGEDAPALVIIAHTRKPKTEDRKSGRALLHELAGSFSLGSVARCVFVMQHASDDETDDRIVWTCCKNNDGELGPRTAWHRRNGLFVPCPDFEWQAFDAPPKDGNGTITKADLETLFESGKRCIARKIAAKELQEQTSFGHTACYNALNLQGRFKAHLHEQDGLLA